MATITQWLDRLIHLRVDNARGNPAPHKPLLLLVTLDLAEAGQLPSRTLALTPDLAFRFFAYFKIVAHRRPQQPDIRLPFYHLHSDGFWSPLDEEAKPTTDRRRVTYAQLPDDLTAFLKDPAARSQARRLLIAHYFTPAERLALYAAVGLPVPSDEALKEDLNFKAADAREAGREVRFRIGVVNAYDYTCALTGYRLTTITGASIVDAAHIHPFARSANNSIDNGIALSKNAHWLFDQGLWSISDDYRVIVAPHRFAEAADAFPLLSTYHGRKLRIPSDPEYWPNAVHIAWHRREHGLQASRG